MPGKENLTHEVAPKDAFASTPPVAPEKPPRQKTPLDTLVERSLSKWETLSPKTQVKRKENVEAAIREYRDVNRGDAAFALITWRGGTAEPGEKPSYLRELLAFMEPSDFDVVGESVQGIGRQTPKKKFVDEMSDFPPLVVEKMVDTFAEAGYLKESSGVLWPTKLGRKSHLGYNALRNAVRAQDLLDMDASPREIETTEDVIELYNENAEKNRVENVKVSLKKRSEKTLYLTKILLGNNATDVKFLDKNIDQISVLPEEMKPDVVVVSGIMQGGFKNQETARREGLVFGMDKQYKSAKLYLDKIRALGASVVYSMSSEDRQIAKEGALEVMQKLSESSGHISYYQQNKLMQDERFDKIKRFQLDVVHPYSMLSGRRLRSAEEVAEQTGGRVETEEFILLWEAYEMGLRGEEIPEEHRDVLEVDNIPFPGKEFDIQFVDDLDLTTTIKGKRRGEKVDVKQSIRSNLQLTDVSLPRNPIAAANAFVRQMGSEGMDVPNSTVITGQQQMLGVGNPNGDWVSSTNGFIDSTKLNEQRGTIARAGSSPALRHLSTRQNITRASSEMHEITDDGRHIITIFDERLMEKSFAAERSTYILITDWQWGSTTARPDMAMKYLNMGTNLMKVRPTYWILDGDIQHGDIYGKHKTENAHMQLIAASSQRRFILSALEKGFGHVTAGDLENMRRFLSVPGNHEYENGNRDNSDVPNDYLIEDIKDLLRSRQGREPEEGRVKGYGSIQTSGGDHFMAWTGIEEDLAGYGVLFKHKLLEKGAKGGGGIPVLQAKTLLEGYGSYAENIDWTIHGHWHHPQIAKNGHTVSVVGPAMAGWSGFEADLGYQAVTGGAFIHVGGGLPPQVEFLSARTIHEYKITDGYFSDKNLRAEGLTTDRGFDPGRHGYAQNRTDSNTRMSAEQKALWEMQDRVVWQADSKVKGRARA